MSSGLDILAPTEADIRMMIAAKVHIGDVNHDHRMGIYVHGRTAAQNHIFDLGKTWEKIMMAARACAAIENPQDIAVISAKPQGQRAILKFGSNCGAKPIAGRFTPGAFTNPNQSSFEEPRLLIVTDPRIDHQAITEAAYVNIPVVALCDSESAPKFVDICIPCNNKGVQSIGLVWWLMAREVLRLRGTITRTQQWNVMPDLFFYRAPEDIEKQELQEKQEADAKKEELEDDQFKIDAPRVGDAEDLADWGDVPKNTVEFPAAPVAAVAAEPEKWDEKPAGQDWSAAEGGEDWAQTPDWA